MAEAQVSAEATAGSSETDAPGQSSAPAPAFAPTPALEHRSDFSSQAMALELRFGPYSPRENDRLVEPDFGNGNRESFFGDKTRFQFGFEIDGQLWRAPHVGTLGVGLGWSYTRRSALNKRPAASDTPVFQTPVGQKTTLSIMPMYAVGVLRVDVLAKEFRVPLVGYGKFGLGYALWWINSGLGTAYACDENERCIAGRDHSVGTQAALGAMFLLDWLEPSAGAELDGAMGINNSYVFLEWSVSNFSGDQMDVGSNTWVTGLAVEF
jgi:hypothetical protein